MVKKKPLVVVGMSGGVDSSVTALLLKEKGYEVIAMFMKNWEEKNPDGSCTSSQDYEDVVKVCTQLDIPYYAVNFVKEYQEEVFQQFLSEYQAGGTPNPDIWCNQKIKFKAFLEKAEALGAEFVATGHYVQNLLIDGEFFLGKGIDPLKDQSYFLYTLSKEKLKKLLFPLGALYKKEVKTLAKQKGLATADKKESMGICFIGKRDFRQFLSYYLGHSPGNFETPEGLVVGKHLGVALYTIGQRQGLAIGGKGEAWFVVGKDVKRNVLIVVQGKDHPALFRNSLIATELSWVSGKPPSPLPFSCKAKIRYHQEDQECQITKIEKECASVSFSKPQRAIASRQSVVFYQDNLCLGGGIIQ